jgi:cysteine desulfurase|tara:strand:+ start:4079 stop:5218 length:1140 start_codon:yes stop_codon:yes gene_type:complete
MEVYFDNAATTPIREEVVNEMSNCFLKTFGNPSSTHFYGRDAKAKLELARKSIAEYLNTSPKEIIFTSGGTESDNMLIKCAVNDLGVSKIISSKIEHHAVLHTLDDLESKLVEVKYVNTTKDGKIDYDHLKELLTEDNKIKLVTLMYINNEIGTILDLNLVGNLCHENKAFFHTDAVQGVGHFEIDLEKLKIDFLSAAAHKFHGPKGIGFSYIKKNSGIKSFILGGSQERGLRAGTEALPNIIGMEKALSIAYDNLKSERQHIQSIKDYFISSILEIFPNAYFNGCCNDNRNSTYTILNIAFPISIEKSSLLDFQLDLKGIACSKGSACQSGSNLGSHVLEEVQENKYRSWPSLRFSFSCFNSKKEVDYLMNVLRGLKD